MEKVMRWISDFALATAGLNEDERKHSTSLNEADLAQLVGSKNAVRDPAAVAKHVALMREVPYKRHSMTAEEFKEVMTVAHFSDYFADAISRAFYADYEYDVGSWRDYTYADTVPDFRDVARFRMSEPGTLYLRREKQDRGHRAFLECGDWRALSGERWKWIADERGRQRLFDLGSDPQELHDVSEATPALAATLKSEYEGILNAIRSLRFDSEAVTDSEALRRLEQLGYLTR